MNLKQAWQVGDCAEIAHCFTAGDVEAFCQLCGDNNPLHMDENYAKSTLAGGRVVHGLLTASWISTLIGTRLPGAGALWNRFAVDWKRMVRIGDQVVFKATVTHVQTEMLELELEGRRQDGELVLEATARVMLMAVPESGQSSFPIKAEAMPAPLSPLASNGEAKTPWRHFEARPCILVTGATGGLGEVVVQQLRLDFPEHQLILWGRNAEKLKAFSRQKGVFTQPVDMAHEREVEQALADLPQNLQLKGLVHMAAAPWRPVAVDVAENLREMELHWKVGLLSYVQMATSLRKHMLAGCSLVALSTQFALEAPPENCSAYISAKLAMEGYTRALALELGPKGIRANMVAPSMINTPYVRDVPVRKKMVEAAKNPLRRLCTAQEVADTIVWLLSDKSSFINGTTIPLTGGLSI